MTNSYYFGHFPLEFERLKAQSEVLKPITRRLLEVAGIKRGHTVLDLGCGAGDVSMLAAELVGNTGTVTGIDTSLDATKLSASRASQAGLQNVSFEAVSAQNFAPKHRFDVVIGRYVLMHQKDPVDFLKSTKALVKKGGILAFHEIDMRTHFATLPQVWSYDAICREFMTAIAAGTPHPDTAGKLAFYFAEAGLSEPHFFCERPVGSGRKTNIHRWAAAVSLSVRHIEKAKEAGTAEIDELEQQLVKEFAAARSQVVGPDQSCAWAII